MGRQTKTWMYTLVAAVAGPLLLWTVTDPIAGHVLEADAGGTLMRITAPWVIAGALLPGAIGLGLAMLLRRLTRHGRLVWLIVSILALLLSMGSPLGGTTVTTMLVLATMHLLVGAAVITGGLRLASR